ncbi:hypothetical protein FSP39_007315 [Pinctada imbricata]|uniref:Reverse transcriptase domain-containing protein n=1 Tax=Pinctada imbricata TaxID=66713 RepID=A0AA89BVX1_PINIB|nr:hypothetical protein FSP39_007315 [Pinctada imbricata]
MCILEEIQSLLEKNAIERVPRDQEGLGFYSTFFIVPKKDGGLRPILNLRKLNSYLDVPHFKMETLRSIVCALEQNDWALSLDLKDAYLHVAVQQQYRQYLRFCVHGHHYQFRAMPFGLAVAPRIFAKLMSAVGSHLRSRQIHVYMYLDDWLIKHQNLELLINHRREVLATVESLGLIVNHSKSQLEPKQIIQYLGSVFNLQKGILYPSQERCVKLMEEIKSIIAQSHQPAQRFLRLLGLMTSCIDLTPWARLHMRPIQYYVLSFWRPHKDNLLQLIPIKELLVQHLNWWLNLNNLSEGVPLYLPQSVTLWTDASKTGWGAHMEMHQISGIWNAQER